MYKWALSSTPLQNRVGELYSLVRFLQLVPYSYYLCKDCDCRTLDHSSTSQCSNCPHSSVKHFCWWNKGKQKSNQKRGLLLWNASLDFGTLCINTRKESIWKRLLKLQNS